MEDEDLAKGVEVEMTQKERERDELEKHASAAENALRQLRTLHKRRAI